MRVSVRHVTHYRYARPAAAAIQFLRLTPRSHDGQFVRRWRVETDADCRLDRGEDAFGNITHTFNIEGPFESMTITAEGDVELERSNGLLRGSIERFPLGFWLRETPLTRAEPELSRFARHIAGGEGGDPLATLHALMRAIHGDFRFEVGSTNAGTTAMESFRQKSGVCQDLAHVFIACSRTLGLPARYVSGYYLRTDTEQQAAGHAWAEAHVAGIGWIAFDPANGVCASERHVRVGIGSDYLEAAPIRGAQTGGRDEQLTVSVEVKPGRRIVVD